MKNNPFALTEMLRTHYTTSDNAYLSEVPTPTHPPSYLAPVRPFCNVTFPISPELSILAEQAQEYLDCHLAPSTLHAYAGAWRGFEEWCADFGLAALPATVNTVGLYISWLAERHRQLSTISQHLAAIKAKHDDAGYDAPTQSPEIKGILRGISRKHGQPPKGADPILVETLQQLLVVIDETTRIGKRDRALLLLGFAGAFRRSELVTLNMADITWRDEGMLILLRRTKTDQQGLGRFVGIPRGKRPGTCPVQALATWLQAAGITEGALFRGMDRADRIISERLSGRAVSLIIKRHAITAGLDAAHLSGHSLRAGHCTSAARAGVSEKLIMQQTGHASHQTLLKYLRLGSIFSENSATSLDL